MKKKQVDTSLAAFQSLDKSRISETKRQIIEVLQIIHLGSSEQIAEVLKLPYDVIWKRCSDLKNEGKIYASESKVLTRRGRFARQWALVGFIPPEPVTESVLPGKSVSDYSKKITEISQTSLF